MVKAKSEVLASPQTFKIEDFPTGFQSSQPHSETFHVTAAEGNSPKLCESLHFTVHSPKVHLIPVYVLCEASSKFLCLDLAIQQVSPLFPCPAAQITCANIPSAPALPRLCHPTALPCRLGDLLAASTTSPASFIFMAWFALTLSSGCCASSHINQ